MTDHGIVILGIPIPSSSPVFLAIVTGHVVVGLGCVITGLVAMLSAKRPGRHPAAGTLYYWSLALVFASMSGLSLMRWPTDSHLFVLGILSFTAATVGRAARRGRWHGWLRLHITGMGLSYILLLTAFYVDNGANLPLWRDLPSLAYRVAPALVGAPILIRPCCAILSSCESVPGLARWAPPNQGLQLTGRALRRTQTGRFVYSGVGCG